MSSIHCAESSDLVVKADHIPDAFSVPFPVLRARVRNVFQLFPMFGAGALFALFQPIVPLAAEAFLDYNLHATHLSRIEIESLRSGQPLASDNKREQAEWEEKKKRLEAGGGKGSKPGAAGGIQADSENHVDGSVLAGISSRVPALLEAHKLSSRAARVGFDWPEIEGLFEKLAEETSELRAELEAAPIKGAAGKGIAGSGKPQVSPEVHERLEDEVGDLFFVLVNIARYLSLDSESALRKANRKFKRRFQWMEEQLRASGRAPQQASMDELEGLWQQAKQQEQRA